MSSSGVAPQKAGPPAGPAVVAILAVAIGLAVAANRLGDPYYAIVHLIGYVFLFGYVVVRLRACFRGVVRAEWRSRLTLIAFWLGLSALGMVGHIGDLFRTGDRSFVRLVTNGCLLFALVYSLELIEFILKAPAVRPLAEEASQPRLGP